MSTWASTGASVYVVRELECLKRRCQYFLLMFKHLEEYCSLRVFNKWTGFSVSFSFNSLGFPLMISRRKKVPQYFIWTTLKWLCSFVKPWLMHSFARVSCVSNRCTSSVSFSFVFYFLQYSLRISVYSFPLSEAGFLAQFRYKHVDALISGCEVAFETEAKWIQSSAIFQKTKVRIVCNQC